MLESWPPGPASVGLLGAVALVVLAGLRSSVGGNGVPVAAAVFRLAGPFRYLGEGGWGVVAAGRLIPVRVGDVEIAVEAVPVTGTEPTAGRAGKAAGNVLEAFARAQDAIVEVARSTAQVIDRAGAAARPDRVEVEFGLSFSASGGVIMAGVAGEASLKVTLGYDVTARPAPLADLPPADQPLTGQRSGSPQPAAEAHEIAALRQRRLRHRSRRGHLPLRPMISPIMTARSVNGVSPMCGYETVAAISASSAPKRIRQTVIRSTSIPISACRSESSSTAQDTSTTLPCAS